MTLPVPLRWQFGSVFLGAMLHVPQEPSGTAILMIPGGSDYRIGSHRSYVRIATELAFRNFHVMRMDLSGMGDSGGEHAGFEHLGGQIASGISALRSQVPPGTKVILWGQCDGASAILMGLGAEFDADGAILCNPWVRTAQTAAEQVMRVHYRRRLFDPKSWLRLLTGQTNPVRSLRNFVQAARLTLNRPKESTGYHAKIIAALQKPARPCLAILGEQDFGGQEFSLFMDRHGLKNSVIQRAIISGGNHSFSTKAQLADLIAISNQWIMEHS